MQFPLAHIGVAVKDLEQALVFYRDALGLPLEGVEEVPTEKVKAAFLALRDGHIELLESTDPEGPIGRFIAKRGEGIHHVALAVPDVQLALDRLKAAGLRLIDEAPRVGAGGKQVAFIHPSATGGVLVELCESEG